MFTDAVLDHRNSLGFTDAGSDLSLRFGSLYLSIETLFRAISNGLTWGEAADALARVSFDFIFQYFSCLFLCVCVCLEMLAHFFYNLEGPRPINRGYRLQSGKKNKCQ